MDYELSDSSGTDDDLPPSHQNRFQRGPHVAGNARSGFVSAPPPLPGVHGDMETQIHLIEQEAYCSVLRAFKAQSDALSWEKEGLITELRKELRVSDEEHRELLSRVNADDMIRKIREWRKTGGHQPGMLSTSQPVHELVHSPTVSASRKKPKTSQTMASMSMGAPSPAVHPSMQPSSGALKRGPLPGPRTKKPKSSMQYPSSGLGGRPQGNSRGPSGTFAANKPAEPVTYDPLIGKKVWTRWPDDNNFYEAVITDYNAAEGRHALVYDINTANETWEWVNLKEDKEMRYTEDISKKYSTDLSKENVGSVSIDSLGRNKTKASVLLLICYTGFTCPRSPPITQISPEDIRWEGDDPGASRRGSRPGLGRGNKKPLTRGGHTSGVGRGRGMAKSQTKKDNPLSQNGVGKKALADIELLHTDTLIKEVEKVFSVNHPDPAEIDKAKRVLKEHEQALVDAIARLEDASDGESDEREREHPYYPEDQGEQGQGRRKRQSDEIHGSGGGRDGVDHH